VSVHDAVSAAWDTLSEDWDNQARHDALRALAVDNGQLKWLASKYRERKGDAIADAQLVKITNAAMVTMLATGSAKREKEAGSSPYKRALLWMFLLGVLMVLGLIAVKLMAATHHTPRP
jgi:hypothetical protein